MRVVDEHECKYTKGLQDVGVQFLVQDIKDKVVPVGWHLINYNHTAPDVANAIRYCPYCGKRLND